LAAAGSVGVERFDPSVSFCWQLPQEEDYVMFFMSKRWLSLLMGALLAAFGILIQVRKQQIREEQKPRPFGQFTQAQIAHRTEPLFHLLAPDNNGWMAFTTVTCPHPEGADSHFWDVDCLQANHLTAANLAYFHWDADTGELRGVSCPPPGKSLTAIRARITAQQAREKSWYWLRALGFAKAGSRWRCDPGPNLGYTSWTLHWRNREVEVIMHLDAVSGKLIDATTGPATLAGR
jgi:hypothetical protein